MAIINYTSAIGAWMNQVTLGTTGDLFTTLLMIVFGLLGLCIAFRIPLEFSAAIVLPVLLAAVIITSQFLMVLGCFLIYLAIILSVRLFIN